MVGVPGKSKGCKTCRKRKIACGQQRPACAQCIKSNRNCLGYETGIYFVPVRASLTDKKLVVTSYFDEIRRQSSRNDSKQKEVPNTARSLGEGCEPSVSHHRGAAPILISGITHGLVNRQQLLNAFLTTCAPRESGQITDFSKGGGGPWMLQLPHLFMQTPALQASISAIAASALGRQHGNQDLIKESLKFYTNGLRELQKSLWDLDVMYNDEVLAACLCLSLYEVMECPGDGRQAYYNHCKGCMRLAEGRGISRHLSGVAHELFLGVRVQGALLSMAIHKPSFLSSPSWMTGPWKYRSKRATDRLVDCLCEASSIYQENDRIECLGSIDKLESWLQSISKCWRMDAMIQDVFKELETNFSQPMYWSVLSKDDTPIDDIFHGSVFPVAYEFSNLRVASSLMMYWAVSFMVWTGLILLYTGIASLEFDAEDAHCSSFPKCESFDDNMCHCRYLRLQPSGSYKYDISHFRPLGHRTDPCHLLDNVCQSIEYCLSCDTAVWGTWSAGTPLTLIYETAKSFPGLENKISWMEATLRKLRERGLRILNYTTTINQPGDNSRIYDLSSDLP